MTMCRKCNTKKSSSEYYASSPNECKECTKTRVRLNREKKAEYYREYDKQRYQNDPRVRERHKRYWETDAGKKSMVAARNKWEEKNPEKRAAHKQIRNAIKRGAMKKPDRCQLCNTKPSRLEGHHNDYTKPLDVMWLCRSCHAKEHRD